MEGALFSVVVMTSSCRPSVTDDRCPSSRNSLVRGPRLQPNPPTHQPTSLRLSLSLSMSRERLARLMRKRRSFPGIAVGDFLTMIT